MLVSRVQKAERLAERRLSTEDATIGCRAPIAAICFGSLSHDNDQTAGFDLMRTYRDRG